MPKYEYDCARCGPFSDFRPLAEYDLPVPCPNCAAESPAWRIVPPGALHACCGYACRSFAILGDPRAWRRLSMLRQQEFQNSTQRMDEKAIVTES